ncbi:MAG: hypothetical protein KFF73_18070 [Cyclobacteriaceae bacterium]|nr:hypothetical protein [Cyclobacteriaceae bacterium]
MYRSDDSFQKIYNRLIPVVIVFPVIFLIFFIVVSMIQLREINKRIEEGQSQTIKDLLTQVATTNHLSHQQLQFITLAVLEEESLSERYNQGHYSLVSRSFKQFLGFFTGIIMVIVGSVFVLLKLKERIDIDANQGETWKISLITSSPGVAFAVVGAILISIASLTKDVISVRDTGLYLTREYLVAPYFTGNGSREQTAADVKEIHEYMRGQASSSDSSAVQLLFPPE